MEEKGGVVWNDSVLFAPHVTVFAFLHLWTFLGVLKKLQAQQACRCLQMMAQDW